MTEKEKMIAGELYSHADPELVAEHIHAVASLTELNRTHPWDAQNYRGLLKKLLPGAPDDLFLQTPFFCDYGYNISFGKNVFINFNCTILDVAPVHIGDNVLLAPNVQIYSAGHPLDYQQRREVEFGKPIVIGDDTWIGGGSIVCPGVKIGARCVVAAGSVVASDVEDDSLVGGVPARLIRKLNSKQ